MISKWRMAGVGVGALCLAGVVGFPLLASAANVDQAYYITVAPTSQNAGQAVTVTGNGQYDTDPFSSDNCDDIEIDVTVTYYDASNTQKTTTISLGTSDGNGDVSGSVTIPADAAPTSVSGHTADLQASCTFTESTYLSQVVPVTVLGTAATTTTTTTTSTTTTTAAASTTTTTTAPPVSSQPPPAPAPQPVDAQPQFTG